VNLILYHADFGWPTGARLHHHQSTMPYLRVETNVSASKAECVALAKKLTDILVKVLGKPAQYISVGVIPDMALVSDRGVLQQGVGGVGAAWIAADQRHTTPQPYDRVPQRT
jgi:phenylpyruvate tautomerase PptA (4-oxalocrotonate tautomerase family)